MIPVRSLRRRSRAACIAAALAVTVLVAACQKTDYVAMARDAAAKGDYASAVIALKNAVQEKPAAAEIRVLLADALERRHELADAEQQLQRAIEAGGDEAALVPRLALMMLDRGDLDGLVRIFKDKRLSDPNADASLRGTLALAQIALARIPAARALIENMPAVPTVKLARAQLLVAAGKQTEALESLALEHAETPWWMLRAGKRLATAAGYPDRGMQYLTRAYQAAPWNLGLAGEYGEALYSAGRFDEAAVVRDALRKSAPRFFWSLYLDALLLSRAGRVDEAHAAALNALKTSPESLPASLLAASAELEKGDLMMANRRLQGLVRSHPDSVPAIRLFAQSQARLGLAGEATATVERGLKLADDTSLFLLKGELEMAAGRATAAEAAFNRVVAARPRDPEMRMPLVQLRLQQGDARGAGELLDEIAALGAANAPLMARAVATALKMGDVERARRLAGAAVKAAPEEPQAQLALAAVKSALRDDAAAWSATLAVLDKHPTNTNALTALAAMASSAQRPEVLARYARAAESKSASAQVFLGYAALLRARPEDKTTLVAALEQGVRSLPQSVPLREALVDAYLRAGDQEKAIAIAQSGATASGAAPAATALLGATYARLGKHTQAVEEYRKLARDYPARAEWRVKLVELEAAAGRTTEATSMLRTLITERPFDPAAYLMLAELSMRNGATDEALSVARQMSEQEGLREAGALLVGDVLQRAGKTDEALAQYGKAARQGSATGALVRIVQLLDGANRRADADRELAAALRKHPGDAAVVGFAARRAQLAGDPGRAAELLQQLVNRAPDNPYLRNDLAWAQLEAGRPEALDNARRAATALPDNAIVLHTYGLALAKAGRSAEALDALRSAANLAPLAPRPRLDLAEQLAGAGDKAGATKALSGIDAAALSGKDKETLGRLKSALNI